MTTFAAETRVKEARAAFLAPSASARDVARPPSAPRPAESHELDAVAARRLISSVNPNGVEPEEDVVTTNGGLRDAGPRDAGPPPRDAGTPDAGPPARNCFVASGPSYSPTGTIPVTTSGGRKRTRFGMAATFGDVAASGRVPACCEVRQYIKWDRAFQTWLGGPPHGGFGSGATYDTWYEDRNVSDHRYGHRSGPHMSVVSGCGDEYKTGATQDQANGNTYCGKDNPGGPDTMTGRWNFQLKVIDTCNGDAVKATSSVITVNW
jgi:hypothetical protein